MENFSFMKKKLGQTAKKYMNIPMIIQRIESQGYLEKLHALLREIKQNEDEFTMTELQKIQENSQQQNDNFDLQDEFINNTSIFEQNFTLILNIIIKEIWDKQETIKFIEKNNQKRISKHNQAIKSLQQSQKSLGSSQSTNASSFANSMNGNQQQQQQQQQQFRKQQQQQQQQFQDNNKLFTEPCVDSHEISFQGTLQDITNNTLNNNTNNENNINSNRQSSMLRKSLQDAKINQITSQPINNIEDVSPNRPTPSFRKNSNMDNDQENIAPNGLQQQQQMKQKKAMGFGNIPLPKSYFTQQQQLENNMNNINKQMKSLQNSNTNSINNNNPGNNMMNNSLQQISESPKQQKIKTSNTRPRVQSTHGSFLSKSHSEVGYNKLMHISPNKIGGNTNNVNNNINQKINKVY